MCATASDATSILLENSRHKVVPLLQMFLYNESDPNKLKKVIKQLIRPSKNNKTNITQEERDMIRCWINQGASIK